MIQYYTKRVIISYNNSFRYYSTNFENNYVIPLIVYNDIYGEKVSILKDNKGKTGIYR
jgi:hypothetical protein